jgi:2'-5' RNA ligase
VPWDAPGSTALVVLAREADPVVGEWYAANSRAGADGMTPHVTLLVPFVPEPGVDESVKARLRRVFGAVAPLEYELRRFERFDDGVLYLAPDPAAPFVAITRSLTIEFPNYLPYDGIHDTIVPHLTVADAQDEELIARIRADVESQLPLACRAGEATLVVRGDDLRWRPRAQYPLGG